MKNAHSQQFVVEGATESGMWHEDPYLTKGV